VSALSRNSVKGTPGAESGTKHISMYLYEYMENRADGSKITELFKLDTWKLKY